MRSADRVARLQARHAILDAVNAHRLDPEFVHVFRMRHLQEAVFIARRFGLVGPDVLEAAGFRAHA